MHYTYYEARRPDGSLKDGINRITFDDNNEEINREYCTLEELLQDCKPEQINAANIDIDSFTDQQIELLKKRMFPQ